MNKEKFLEKVKKENKEKWEDFIKLFKNCEFDELNKSTYWLTFCQGCYRRGYKRGWDDGYNAAKELKDE